MQLVSLTWNKDDQWSEELPDLDSNNTLVTIFGSQSFMDAPGAIQELAEKYSNSHIIGCSTSGEIFDTELNDDSLAVAISKFENTTLKVSYVAISGTESKAAGQKLASELSADDLAGLFVLSDGLKVNGTHLVNGINETLPKSVPVTGGLAGDGSRFERTWVIKDGLPVEGHICAVGFYGDKIRIGHGSKGGWETFGPERKITKSADNVLFELDGEPALDIYKKYLGDKASDLPGSGLLFPLAIRESMDAEKTIVRTLLAVDEEKQSLTFAGNMPEGFQAQLMKAQFDQLVSGANGAAKMIETHTDVGPVLCIAISCVGRRLVLGEHTEDEIESTLEVLPKNTQQVGFYSYGEISPHVKGASCDLHNQTMTLTTFAEAS